MPPVSWQNALDDVGYMSDDQNTLITSPLHHNPWLKPNEPPGCDAQTANKNGAHWNLWNPVPFPRWQFHLNSSIKSPHNENSRQFSNYNNNNNNINNSSKSNNSPRAAELSFAHMNDNPSPSIMINDSPCSPQSIITISSSSEAEEDMATERSNNDDSSSKLFVTRTSKSMVTESSLIPSSSFISSGHVVQRSSPPRTSTSGRYINGCEKIICKQEPPFIVSRTSNCNSIHEVDSRPATFKSPMTTSENFEMMNVVPSNNDKIVCKQEPLFIVPRSSRCNSRHDSHSTTFKSPAVCSIPITANSMCVLPPCFISTATTVQPTLVYPQNSSFINRGQDLCTLIPQNICLHLPPGVQPGEMNCSRCCREESLRGVPDSVGRLHLSQKFHMNYSSSMDRPPNVVPATNNTSSSSFYSGNYY